MTGTLYLVVFAIAGLFYKDSKETISGKFRKFVVLIPGYKEDPIIVDVVKKTLEQDYPAECYDVVVIADSFNAETLENLKILPVKVIEVQFERSSKAKSLNKAMKMLPDDYEVALILDADNVMENDFISKMNQAFNRGFQAIQGHRLAKNLNTHLAVLDAVSEEINNNIFRRGHRVLGLSAAFIGSGLAVRYPLYKHLMEDIASFGEDKELEHRLLKNRVRIEYLDEALVYDEKIAQGPAFINQRIRWIANQLDFSFNYFIDGIKELFHGNIDLFDKVIQHLIPPRIFMLGFLSIIVILSLIFNSLAWNYAWIFQLLLCALALWISVPQKHISFKTIRALLSLPYGFYLMLVSLSKVHQARREFFHTTHNYSENHKTH
ncbi:MAG: glycosyltransferase family 2 protein [Bacteroidota bacterium]|nr:glycosyltransferase family 2 protein [Bacteroidota bacterium]